MRNQTETPKRYRYTGKERDEESGLYYHGARYYAPWLGRWTSCDPVSGVSNSSLYTYVRNNPLIFRDPGGLQEEFSWESYYKGPEEWKTYFVLGQSGTAGEQALMHSKWMAMYHYSAAESVVTGPVESLEHQAKGFLYQSANLLMTPTYLAERPALYVMWAMAKVTEFVGENNMEALATIPEPEVSLASQAFVNAYRFYKVAASVRSAAFLEGSAALKVGAAAQDLDPRLGKLRLNSEIGLPARTEQDLARIATEQGIEIPDYVKLRATDKLKNPAGALAEYGQFGELKGGFIYWESKEVPQRSLLRFLRGAEEGQLVVKIHPSVLLRDESIVAHLGHEMYEIDRLEGVFLSSSEKMMSVEQYMQHVGPGLENFHSQAWDYASQLVWKMRGGAP